MAWAEFAEYAERKILN